MSWILAAAAVLLFGAWTLSGLSRYRRTQQIVGVALFCPPMEPISDSSGESWMYELRSMTARNSWFSTPEEEKLFFHLRRMEGPEWQMMLTTDSYMERTRKLVTSSDSNPFISNQEKADILHKLSKWHPAPAEHQGELEHRYQVLLRLLTK